MLSTLMPHLRLAVLGAACLALVSGCETFFDKAVEPPRLSAWSPEEGWAAIEPGQPSPTAAALRADALKALQAGNTKDALAGLKELERAHGSSQEAREAYTAFLLGECYYNLNDYESAYRSYLTALQRRPPTETLDQTLSRIYAVGLAYLRGAATRSFVVDYRSPTYGVEILIGEQGLVTRYPNQPYSDDALLEVSNYYYDRGEYPDAERVLERLVREYPASEWHELAEYRLALTVYKQVRGVEYDQAPLKRARRHFDQYRLHYPRGHYIDEVRQHLRDISETEAAHELKVAKYYLRESRPEAAVYYLRSVLLNHPKTEAFREAQEIHNQLARFQRAPEIPPPAAAPPQGERS